MTMGSLGSRLPGRLLQQLLLLLLVARHRPLLRTGAGAAAAAEAKFGCLFEDDLCKTYEICVNDGVFGKCQRVPVIDVNKYEISPSALHRLKIVLEKLLHRGFTWHDDYTQHIIARELSDLPKTHDWHLETSSSKDLEDSTRISKQEPERNLEKDVDFASSPQQYLAYLDILSQSGVPNLYSTINANKSPFKVGNIPPRSMINYMMQNSKGKTPAMIYSVPVHSKYIESIPARTFSKSQMDIFQLKPEEQFDRKDLLMTLNAYITQKLSAKNLDGHSSVSRTKETSPYDNRVKPLHIDQFDGIISKEKLGGFEMKPQILQRPVSGLVSGSTQNDLKLSLTPIDEIFIQDVLRELRKHHVDVDKLSPLELDKMADIIAEAVQIVDTNGEKNNAAGKVEGERTATGPDTEGKNNYETGENEGFHVQDKGPWNIEAEVKSEEDNLDSKVPDFLSKNMVPENLSKSYLSKESFKTEMKKSDDLDLSSSSEEIKVGIENVKSETFSRELIAQKKAEFEPNSKELSELHQWIKNMWLQDESVYEATQEKIGEGLKLDAKSSKVEEYGYIMTEKDPLSEEKGLDLIKEVAGLLKLQMTAFADINMLGPAVTFKMYPNALDITTADVVRVAADNKSMLEKHTGLKILKIGMEKKNKLEHLPHHAQEEKDTTKFIILSLLSIACILGVLMTSGVIYCFRHGSHHKLKEKLTNLGSDPSSDATATYQELCRQRMAVKTSDCSEPLHASRINSISSQFSDGPIPSPSTRSSTSSWCEEPVQSNMDISTGHIILMDHDPRNPAYIAAQGALPSTVTDFWQMVWENGCVVIVMLTPLTENGLKQCYHYWPDEGSNLYHIYEVNLVSEHIWCEDFLVRSFYLKNLQSNETRTVTQFHYLTWHDQQVPASTRSLLDFRRKINKCYKGRSCPIVVHCSDGAGRTGTYILIDMVLNKMAKGAKEIDIAATLEHLRDQRPGMVQTKEQFEFALTAVAEEVNAILKALPQ
ncbi:receptor-type tyrosine-protein phosphatase N2 isoform X1 [Pantherophis guttatus]|uniref:Receptor-type tyrosine-protein phosphatase N2 isoform X1 n=1 Tax=Pantherophis guttatus TaxID=94885 RepID=A0ABM3YTX2_PANGU|nr:receptor-type tyrosine-protein phosphatase N2 isoform X1 [Pantherophis guttatus]